MLFDLREVHTIATGVSADWETLGQAAQGSRNRELLAFTKRCHPDTLRRVKWANGKLEEASTQILIS